MVRERIRRFSDECVARKVARFDRVQDYCTLILHHGTELNDAAHGLFAICSLL